MSNEISRKRPDWPSLLFGDGTPHKAAVTALIVGTLLTAINHGDLILAGQFPPFLKVLLTYCVPYCVTTWGAVTGKIAQAERQFRDQDTNAQLNGHTS
ncbi:nitrate/nitrite transporter NrtS [Sulfitobacter mediterraneus]|jgi:hypothetical protein|uniref:nitrate/nitrite transporter NrtS n=1 Tax=Sulfitobacter mediterraneus TaxID=83219 RepID=UPI001933B6DE|nr:nitrate/nitrite transporter NrtS [Sulfitobacter mediterraneus]MBM1634723.1 nitrate/nitrite transporter NrtS [Sulfitobacter mediterraneus]MBM1642541.1 nitrate/nitrite transporter NrtS [Sulfitobacter mediterraneus]MBM1646589.1 nitrate/nitrite transporter NrtS [Sulfitobacter mediterraneus]MBM1650635.1 nitrate/nitrite transporter NrtS [Sulfitobacter mediterraneus]MBM1654657.1 nitrate/nitrite transporter NrtS [Sulfitobacter mediterraneus]